MDKQISMISKTSQPHLRNIGNRKFLGQVSAETSVHSFVKSKINYYNVILFGIPKDQINKLQLVLNTAARVVTLARSYNCCYEIAAPVTCILRYYFYDMCPRNTSIAEPRDAWGPLRCQG